MKTYKFTFIILLALVFAGCSMMQQTASPTDVFKSQFEAQKKKDTATMKANLSKGSLEMMEKFSKAQNKTVDELLMQDTAFSADQPTSIETRNEKISGDTATIETKFSKQDEWVTVPFVKEDGKWKIAFDKFMQDLMQKMSEQMNMPTNNAPDKSIALPANK